MGAGWAHKKRFIIGVPNGYTIINQLIYKCKRAVYDRHQASRVKLVHVDDDEVQLCLLDTKIGAP